MAPFEKKSLYYDLIYQSKDYREEVEYVLKYLVQGNTLADFGCGTGSHLELFNKLFDCFGFDASKEMIKIAKNRIPSATFEVSKISDISGYQFDNIISLFHVINYHTTDKNLIQFFESSYHNLAPNGVFCFDFWNIEGVKVDPPTSRTLKIEKDGIQLTRRSVPSVTDSELIKITFEFDIKGNTWNSFQEDHFLRAFDKEYLFYVAKGVGYKSINFYRWLTDDELKEDWYGFCVCEK